MKFTQVVLLLLSLTFALATPLPDLPEDALVARNGKKAPAKPIQFDGTNSPTSRMRAENNRPGREIPKACKKLADCSCPKPANGKGGSTSCINGFCSCNNKTIAAIGNKFIEGIAAIGNAPITKVIGHLMSGIATVKQVVETIGGAVLPPPMRAALKVAINVIPDTGPSHIDKLGKAAINKALG